MTMAGTRARGRSGPGRMTWVALGGAALMVLGLTFALGMLVGRQWARQTPPAAAAEPGRRAAAAARRAGLADVSADRASEPAEKLTFYKTLTAPLGAAPLPARPEGASKRPSASASPVASPPAGASEPSLERVGAPALPTRASASSPVEDRLMQGGERPVASPDWAVQVGVFKSVQQADRVKKTLVEAGFPAKVTAVTGDDGQPWYRVRVSGFRTRDEALKTAERVRADRSLPTFVTAN